MKLHILSDLHLTVAPLPRPDTDADVVILAGDIARPAEAVEWASGFARPTLYVAGNHEFYGSSIDETRAGLARESEGTCVRVLDDDIVVLNGVRFVGSTLWTDFLLDGANRRDEAMREAQRFIRDFSRIRVGDRAFTPEDSTERFATHRRFLAETLATPFDGPTVVITHHAPAPPSVHPRFRGSPLNACFVSDLTSMLDGARAKLWIHGHTHDSFDYAVNGTRVLCNPRGYALKGVNENARFDPGLIVSIDDAGPTAQPMH
jgi:predicted phosphodiesterase